MSENTDNYKVTMMVSEPDKETVVVTASDMERDKWEARLKVALSVYDPENKQYSTYLTESSSSEELTIERLDELASGLQSNLTNVNTVNSIIRNYINKDDLIGITYDAIEANVNTEFKLAYKKFPEMRNKTKQVENVRALINDFNDQINIKRLLRIAIPLTFAEGNCIMYLRNKDGNYIVDVYPLGIAEISDYSSNSKPIVLINIQNLRNALQKTMLMTRSRQPLFFATQDEEVSANYPPEVYEAYKSNETYAKLDVDRTGVIRVGNLNRKYGVSPILRALKPALMLETFDSSDRTNSKARAKKIIAQTLRKELMGPQYDRTGYKEMSLAHDNLMRAWKQSTVVVTTPPYVEKIDYVEPTTQMTNIDNINYYRNREMAALGISFLNTDGSQTVSTANISLDQLMKNINKIAEQLADVIKQWYYVLLKDNNIDIQYCPEVTICASEMMSNDIKRQIAGFLFSTLNCSYDTAYNILGYAVEDEKDKRERENDNGYNDIFAPRQTSYTSSGNNSSSGNGNSNNTGVTDGLNDNSGNAGRPKSDVVTEKQVYDEQRYQNMKDE